MRRLAAPIVSIGLAAAAFWPGAASASITCGDFLAALAKKPQHLAFVECKAGRLHQLRALIASYRVRGEHAAGVEAYLHRHAKMAMLRFYCCGWEPNVRSKPRWGQLRDRHGNWFEVSMSSQEGVVAARKDWRRIDWFYVTVLLPLEEP